MPYIVGLNALKDVFVMFFTSLFVQIDSRLGYLCK